MLPGVGVSEYILIAIAALVVIGPKDLPMLMRKAGAFINRLRGMAAEFRASFDEMARQSELDELRKQVEELRSGQLMAPISNELQPAMAQIEGDVRTSLSTDWSGAPLTAGEEPDTQPSPTPARKRKAPASKAAKAPKTAAKAAPKTAPKTRPAPKRATTAAKPASVKAAKSKAPAAPAAKTRARKAKA